MPPRDPLLPPPASQVASDVRTALVEDVGPGDVTAELLPAEAVLDAQLIAREEGIFCGRAWFDETFAQLDALITVDWQIADGDRFHADQVICRVRGLARPILSGERTALNFIQTLSGTATTAHRYAAVLEGTATRVLDTRKTLPGLRQAQKYAVRCGGGENHRLGLFDAILIKENHIQAAGGIAAAVQQARQRHGDMAVEVEVETIGELEMAIAAGADRAMLDNFDLDALHAAVARAEALASASATPRIELEASGNVTLDDLPTLAATGVDFISTGAITKHVRAIDFSLRFIG